MNFKIGDKVMANFGQYRENWYVDEIIGDTKTLWKCKKISFHKTGFHRVRGHGDSYHPIMVEHYNEEVYSKYLYDKKLKIDYLKSLEKVNSIEDNKLKEAFIEWVNNNLNV